MPWIALEGEADGMPPTDALGTLNLRDGLVEREGVLVRWITTVRDTPEVAPWVLRMERDLVSLRYTPRPGSNAEVVRFLLRDLDLRHAGRRLPTMEIQLALHEALANAMEHGNLGITFDEKSVAMETAGGVRALVDARLLDPKLAARSAHVRVRYDQEAIVYVIRDEGRGFDATGLGEAPMADATALHGRGLKMILHVMDEVRWSDDGTEITMSKRLDSPSVFDDDEDDDPDEAG